MNQSKFPHTSTAIYSTQPGIWRIYIILKELGYSGLTSVLLVLHEDGHLQHSGFDINGVNIRMRVLASGPLLISVR